MQNSQENTGAKVSFLIKLQVSSCKFIRKETLAQVFSCEFCEVFKIVFFTKHLWATASVYGLKLLDLFLLQRTRVVACIDEVIVIYVFTVKYTSFISFYLLSLLEPFCLQVFIINCTERWRYVMRCAIWCHLYNLKNVKNNHGSGVSTVDYENVNASWVYSYTDVDTSLIKYFILNNVFKMECGKTELVKISTAVW